MTGEATFLLGDVFEQIATLPDDSVDLIVSSPPFLALRSYLPDDHPDKAKEIGSEPNPADYLDTLVALVAALDRVIAPHGTLVFELGDTYAGSGGAGGDYGEGGLRAGQPAFKANPGRSVRHQAEGYSRGISARAKQDELPKRGAGWPLDKSLTGIPTLFAWSLAYGRNLLTGEPSPAGQWRIRNVIPWCRPNPPVGALGDKWRPATSYVIVACRARDRWFDLDAVRTPLIRPLGDAEWNGNQRKQESDDRQNNKATGMATRKDTHDGAPPLDWYLDPTVEHQLDDGIWVIPTAPYKGAHYAAFPPELVRRLIECMCPREVCRECGKPRRRIVEDNEELAAAKAAVGDKWQSGGLERGLKRPSGADRIDVPGHRITLGWTECGHGKYRPGVVLDPFVGSGTTMAVAVRHGRDAIGIDIDERNIALARQRMGNLPLEAPTVAAEWDEGSLFREATT